MAGNTNWPLPGKLCGRQGSTSWMELPVVIVVICQARSEQTLQAGQMPCPACGGALRPHGRGRTRTVRGTGNDRLTVTPRRARCVDCGATQILLPTALTVRRADTTEVIGNALVAKVNGAGHRSIAVALGRPVSTVRRWLRQAGGDHPGWLHQRGVAHAVQVDRELLVRPAPQRTPLGHALNLLIGAAVRYRQVLALDYPVWSLIGMFTQGRLIAAPLRT